MHVSLASGYAISDDPAVVDHDRLYGWLSTDAYWWSGGLHRSVFDAAVAASLSFSALSASGEFVGYGRMVTDRASFAYWCDVYVDPAHRRRGLARELTRCAVEHPALATCRRMLLATRDAHRVYEQCGFAALADPAIFMEISRPAAGASPTLATLP